MANGSGSFSMRPSHNPLKRNRSPGESDFWALFQLLTTPALLVDTMRDQIMQANPAFLHLTAVSANDVVGRTPQTFLIDLPESLSSVEEGFFSLLERRSRPSIAVQVQCKTLDPTGPWRVLLCYPLEDARQPGSQWMDRYIKGMIQISRLPIPSEDVLQKALEAARAIFRNDAAAVYRATGQEVVFQRVAVSGEADLLPTRFSTGYLEHMARPLVWKPGRLVQTELQRAARVQSLSYLASAPFEPQSLLVIAARQQEPLDRLGELVSLVAEHLGGLSRSIDMIQRLQTSLLESERDLHVWKQMVEDSGEGMLLLTPDLTIREMNPAAEWMLGYAAWEVQGQPVENVIIGPERLGPALEAGCQGVTTHNMGVVSLHRRNGQSFPVEIRVIPVFAEARNPESVVVALILAFADVSEHEEIRQRTQQLEQRAVLGEVTAVFAHEVRNPINNISTGLQLLSFKLPPDDPNQENIARLINDCQRLNHLMESVLNFSRHTVHSFEEVDVELLLRRLLDRWRPRMAKVNVIPLIHVGDTRHLLADPRSLEQVFTNLISNAVEAMSSQGGTLAVRLSPYLQPTGLPVGVPSVEISISDTGPGIPDEIRERIFEPFVTTKQQGTGLGLAITKRIVTAHHGSIRVNSFPGGTVFSVIIPAFNGEQI